MATPAFVKRILTTDAFQSMLALPSAIYFQIVMWTARFDRSEFPIPEPYILAMWHGRLIMLPMLRNRGKPLIALISGHRDGKVISRIGAAFGIQTAVGSSSKGGMRAAREMMRLGKSGHSLFVTPDGPRGPRMQINSEGVLDLARLTGLPILPVSVSLSRNKLLKSWDRLMLPGLFSKVGLYTYVDQRFGGGRVNDVTTEDIVKYHNINGEEWLFYIATKIDVAFIRGTSADPSGNISMEKEALVLDNLAQAMAAHNNGGLVIAQVERIVEQGSIKPKDVHVPGILVSAVVVAESIAKR